MSYYLRYITTDQRSITPLVLDAALRKIDTGYRLVPSQIDTMSGDLIHSGLVYGELEVNRPGDDIFEEDIADLRELVVHTRSEYTQRVLDTLDNAQAIVAVRATWQGTESEQVLSKIDPLWNWLFEHCPGLLYVDSEGFYDNDGLILQMNVRI
jgi:hypothetical protein